MSQQRSIFYNHWRECLQQHFLYVVRTHDAITEPTLREVLKNTGFTDTELEVLYQEGLRLREAEAEMIAQAQAAEDKNPM